MRLPDFYNADLLFDTKPDERGKPFVTVCLSVYKFERTVLRAINTLLEQTCRDFEIVISDDMSPDNSIGVILDFLKTYSGDIRMRLYRAKENGGVVRNRSRGMFYGNGDLFVFTDGDDFSAKNRVEVIVRTWKSYNVKPSVLATRAWRYYEGSKEPFLIDSEDSLPEYYPPGDPVFGKMRLGSNGYVISRALFEKFKYVDIPRGLIADDPVFARRAMLQDGIRWCSEPVFYIGLSSASASGGGVFRQKMDC